MWEGDDDVHNVFNVTRNSSATHWRMLARCPGSSGFAPPPTYITVLRVTPSVTCRL